MVSVSRSMAWQKCSALDGSSSPPLAPRVAGFPGRKSRLPGLRGECGPTCPCSAFMSPNAAMKICQDCAKSMRDTFFLRDRILQIRCPKMSQAFNALAHVLCPTKGLPVSPPTSGVRSVAWACLPLLGTHSLPPTAVLALSWLRREIARDIINHAPAAPQTLPMKTTTQCEHRNVKEGHPSYSVSRPQKKTGEATCTNMYKVARSRLAPTTSCYGTFKRLSDVGFPQSAPFSMCRVRQTGITKRS